MNGADCSCESAVHPDAPQMLIDCSSFADAAFGKTSASAASNKSFFTRTSFAVRPLHIRSGRRNLTLE